MFLTSSEVQNHENVGGLPFGIVLSALSPPFVASLFLLWLYLIPLILPLYKTDNNHVSLRNSPQLLPFQA